MSFCTVIGSSGNFLMVTVGPSRAMGGSTTLTRGAVQQPGVYDGIRFIDGTVYPGHDIQDHILQLLIGAKADIFAEKTA